MPAQDMASSEPEVRRRSPAQRLDRLPRLRSSEAASGLWLRMAFFALLALTPLPFGSNRPIWWTLLALLVGALLAAYAWRIWSGKERPGIGLWAVLPIILPYLCAMLWAVVQTVALPPIGLGHPIWAIASDALGRPLGEYISLDPHKTATYLMRLLSYAGIFWLALEFGRDRAFAERLLRVLTWVGMIYATYGVIMHVFGIERILWVPKWAYQGFLTSTFVNRNSYATYAALGLICSVAILTQELREVLLPPMETKRRWMGIIQTLTGAAAVPLMASCILGTAILQTGSRAGAMCTLVGLLVFLVLAGFAQLIHWRQIFIPAFFIALISVILLFAGGTTVLSRIDTLKADRSERRQMYEITAQAIGDAPVIGTGLGTFQSIFNMYRRPNFAGTVHVDNAHNSYLENALELGLPAAILLIASVGGILEACALALRRRKRGRLFPVVGISAITIVGLHSIVDFSLEIPAVAITFAAIAGVACAQSFRSSRRTRLKFKVLPQDAGNAGEAQEPARPAGKPMLRAVGSNEQPPRQQPRQLPARPAKPAAR